MNHLPPPPVTPSDEEPIAAGGWRLEKRRQCRHSRLDLQQELKKRDFYRRP